MTVCPERYKPWYQRLETAKKRLKHVYPKIYEFEQLHRAHRLARRAKRSKEEVVRFELDLNRNLMTLRDELLTQTYRPGAYREFKVFEPKERVIMSLPYRDRVVQHSLCDQVLGPWINRQLIDDNCASRPRKGTHYGLYRLARFMREFYHTRGTEGYILKADISKFFYRIRHDRLKEMLYPGIADPQLKGLLDVIIDSTPGNVGVPIGNMTSQWFAIYESLALSRQK